MSLFLFRIVGFFRPPFLVTLPFFYRHALSSANVTGISFIKLFVLTPCCCVVSAYSYRIVWKWGSRQGNYCQGDMLCRSGVFDGIIPSMVRIIYGIKKRVSGEMPCFWDTQRDQEIYSNMRLGQCNRKTRIHTIPRHSTCVCVCVIPEKANHYPFECFRYMSQITILLRAFEALSLPRDPVALDDLRAVSVILRFVRTSGKLLCMWFEKRNFYGSSLSDSLAEPAFLWIVSGKIVIYGFKMSFFLNYVLYTCMWVLHIWAS